MVPISLVHDTFWVRISSTFSSTSVLPPFSDLRPFLGYTDVRPKPTLGRNRCSAPTFGLTLRSEPSLSRPPRFGVRGSAPRFGPEINLPDDAEKRKFAINKNFNFVEVSIYYIEIGLRGSNTV